MGQAIITEAIGQGLYRAVPVLDFTRITLESTALQAQEDAYFAVLLPVLTTKELLEQDVAVTRLALNEVIDQWRQALIDKGRGLAPLPPPTEDDPETGEPWDDPDRGQDDPLLAAINAARGAAGVGSLTINADLSAAARRYLRDQEASGRTGHLDAAGRGPAFRVSGAGYGASAVVELLAYGPASPAAAVATWRREYPPEVIGADWQDVGVAYVSGKHWAGHLWAALLAIPGPPADEVAPDPATKVATDSEAALKKITAPKIDDLSPDQLGQASQAYGIAIAKLRAAEREIARLQAEHLARGKRIDELNAAIAAPVAIDVWCIDYDESMTVGSTVSSLEVPGFWQADGALRTSTLYKDTPRERVVSWVERSWNLAPPAGFDAAIGVMTPALALTDAAAFVNIALEPGHLKWRPRWRYATITAKSGTTVSIALVDVDARPVTGEAAMGLNAVTEYSGVSVRYPCGHSVFLVGDEVFVLFDGDTPTVVGFRREPKTCSGRVSWRDLR